MDLSFDILDHIFGFLRSHPESLIACSEAHPDFSQIAERHRYYHTIIHPGATRFAYSLIPTHLLELISETPRIVNHVRVLQIEFHRSHPPDSMTPLLEDIGSLLPRFPLIECLMLSNARVDLSWQKLPQIFRTAVEGCLHLPTLQEVHIGDLDFPLSLLDQHTTINLFSLTGNAIPEYPDITFPQLKSLSVKRIDHRFTTWAKHRIGNLQSLECTDLACETISDLLEGCPDLKNLDIGLLSCNNRGHATTYYNLEEVELHFSPISINLSSLRHLQRLTIRSEIYFEEGGDQYPFNTCVSYLPALIEMLKTASSLQHLNIDLSVDVTDMGPFAINFSPLTALVESCAPFHHIDLYTSINSWRAGQILGQIECCPGLRELIDQGTLIIHEEETAPLLPVHSRSTLVQHPLRPYEM